MNLCLVRILCIGIFLVESAVSSPRGCDRGRSRLVRRVVYEKVLPAFSAMNTELSDECVVSPARDRYRTQEMHKYVQEGTKWYCGFCGKSFVNEHFLDLHFDNRHTDHLEEENALCLADECEVFRCDIIGGSITADYWDIALCLEDDMTSLHRKCESMVQTCVPSGLTVNETRSLTEVTIQELCSYLTCAKYWEIPFESGTSGGIAGLYIILTVLVTFGIVIYYCIFYTYFYTDAFSDSMAYDPAPRIKQKIKPFQPDLRQRPRPFPSPHPD
ncbi:uncharacterized protein [Littorina saxatilis]|uniref:C2H2-type domain-containing protein n=1 Tax=Littorina saxatilis TaxID=31220 RepID=A0AAN9BZ97_9CAEN